MNKLGISRLLDRRSRMPRQVIALVGVAVLLVSLGVALSTAPRSGAHLWKTYSNGDKKWYFRPTLASLDDPLHNPEVDPVTLIFHGGNDAAFYTSQNVLAKLETFIPDMQIGCYGPDPPGPVGCIRINCNGREEMVWRDLNGGLNHDKEDINRSTSDTCEDQVHIRLWDDQEHRLQFAAGVHPASNWVVGSVHKEKRDTICDPFGLPGWPNPIKECHHDRISTFERQARNIAAAFDGNDNWCADRKWHFLPGSANGFGRDYSDGYLTEIIHDDSCTGAQGG